MSLLEATKKNAKQDIDDESSDELSDEDSRVGLETDNAERFNDSEDNASGGEKNEQKEENENIKMDESDVSYLTRAIKRCRLFCTKNI